jgi:hypothetical protein
VGCGLRVCWGSGEWVCVREGGAVC